MPPHFCGRSPTVRAGDVIAAARFFASGDLPYRNLTTLSSLLQLYLSVFAQL
jgi:hypothetical protein